MAYGRKRRVRYGARRRPVRRRRVMRRRGVRPLRIGYRM